ncbi:MAG: endo-1,4-beta-xylanase, partial [Oscillospiraceae bacterium]|nr:endo-1,4-beta-xylanase [Oscillospiraceae bacterium]
SPGSLRLYITAGSPNADYYMDAAGFWDADCMPEAALSEAVSDFVPETVYHEGSSDGLPRRAHQNDTYTYVHGGGGLKDLLGPFFRTGFCASAAELEDPAIQALYRQHFNSAACKTELLPEHVIREIGNGSVTVSLEAAAPVLRFAEQNGLSFRGSALVNGSSMPEEMLCGSLEESEALLESEIRETFALLKQDYPDLDLYAYDVCRNVIPQISGCDADSAWAALSEEDRTAYIIAAFRYARAYAPAECKLFLSVERVPDSDEINAIAAIVEKITEAGDYIDGIAVQAHLTPEDVESSKMDEFFQLAWLGLDIQITEMQGRSDDPYEPFEYTVPENLLEKAIVFSEVITSVTFHDPVFPCNGWDGGTEQRECSLFDESLEPQILYQNLPVIAGYAVVLDAQGFEYAPSDQVYDSPGDADCNGELESYDAVLVMMFLAEDPGAVLSEQGMINADVNCDGMITVTDVNWILRGVRVLSMSSGTFGTNDNDEWRDL